MRVSMKIRAEVEVHVGSWGDDCTFEQLAEQVRREGANILNAKLRPTGTVIGTPRVLAVILDEDTTKGGASCRD